MSTLVEVALHSLSLPTSISSAFTVLFSRLFRNVTCLRKPPTGGGVAWVPSHCVEGTTMLLLFPTPLVTVTLAMVSPVTVMIMSALL